MAWPMSQDYNEAIQSPALCFNDPELQRGEATTNAIGLPMPRSGNFADVYEFNCPARQRKWAIKCFTREVPGLRERYAEISAYLKRVNLPFMVDFTYLDPGIKVRGQWFPVLKMQWVEGFTLNEFVKQHSNNPPVLEKLCQLWVRLARRLREANLAHADLQHGNVLLVPGKGNSLNIKLIDYDGMFVPALAKKKSGEVGHPAYQHPQRIREGTYNLEVDRFPHLVIYTALRSLMIGSRNLWTKYDNGDNLLFRQPDLETPGNSALFQDLSGLNDPEVSRLVQTVAQSARKPLEQTSLLHELVANEKHNQKAVTVPGEPAPGAIFASGTALPSIPKRKQQGISHARIWAASVLGMVGVVLAVILFAANGGPELSESKEVAQANTKIPAPVAPKNQPKTEPKITTSKSGMEDADSEAVWRIAGEWQNQGGGTFSLDPNGIVSGTAGLWFVQEQRLVFLWPNKDAPGGAWIDYCTLTADNRSYQGRNQGDFKVSGTKLKDHPRRAVTAPILCPPDLLGAWQLGWSGGAREITLNANGQIQGGGSWFARDSSVLLLWPDEKHVGGFWADILTLAPGRQSATGRNLANDPNITLKKISVNSKVVILYELNETVVTPGLGPGGGFSKKPTSKAIMTHPPADGHIAIAYQLGKKYRLFTTTAKIADWIPERCPTGVIFKVLSDGKVLWQSKHLHNKGESDKCSISVEGVNRLELQAHSPGHNAWAHALWVEPTLMD